MKPVKVALVVNFITTYRNGFYTRLLSRSDLDIHIFCQLPPAGSSLKVIHEGLRQKVTLSRALYFRGESLVWTHLPWRKLAADYDVVVVEGNPRYLSLAVLATYLSVRRRIVILWTMVHSYRGAGWGKTLRLAWTRLFRNVLVYSDFEVDDLLRVGFTGRNLTGINNGLDQAEIAKVSSSWDSQRLGMWRKENLPGSGPIILSCARLEQKNEYLLMVDAMPKILARIPNAIWVLIGDGPERNTLAEAARVRGLEGCVRFLGALHEEQQLAPWFLSAEILVHPGAIGLSLLHAFGYGVPVVTHGDAERHGPEFRALKDRGNGRVFRRRDAADLASVVVEVLSEGNVRAAMSRDALQTVSERFNSDMMVERFVAAIRKAIDSQ